MRRVLLLACAVLLAACSSGEPDASAPAPGGREEGLDAALEELGQSGIDAVVAVSLAGGPPVVREFGALRDDEIAPRDALVDVGSITKSVTAVLVLRLVDDDRLRLDETLGEILDGVPADTAAISMHQLLTHTGGLVSDVGYDFEPIGPETLVDRALGMPMSAAPGERYAYSNVGYAVLAAVIEARADMSYDAFLGEVLADAGLEAMGYGLAYDESRSIRDGDGRPVRAASWGGHDPGWNLVGNGGLVATPPALLGFLRAVDDGRLLSAESVALLRTPHVPEDASGATSSSYGYGLVVDALPGMGSFTWHDGGNDIFSAEWNVVAGSDDVLVAAAVDTDRGDAFTAMSTLRQSIYGARR